ncbi:MAG: hypothetical protein IJ565_00710 [Bacilli bacterium]|nr:hypothetical protein [Bacilli bacterium]
MQKISLKIEFHSDDMEYLKEFDGTIEENRIIYNEDGIKMMIDLNNNIIARENDDFKIEIDLSSNKCTYYLKEHHLETTLEVESKIIKKDNKILIEYFLIDNRENKIIYNIEYNIKK